MHNTIVCYLLVLIVVVQALCVLLLLLPQIADNTTMPEVHRCPHCQKLCKTLGGLKQHIDQAAKCRQARNKQLGITGKPIGLLGSLLANKRSAPTRSELALQQMQQQIGGDSVLGKRPKPATVAQTRQEQSPSPKKKRPRKRNKSPSPKKVPPPEPESGPPARKSVTMQQLHEAQHGTAKEATGFLRGLLEHPANSGASAEAFN